MSDQNDLSARLAERLLGWLRADQFEEIKALAKWAVNDRALQITIDACVEQGLTMVAPDGRFARPPDLSGSWEGAGLVLEAMVARGWEPYIGYLDGQWYGGTQLPYQGRDPVADTGPMVVCLAAEAALKGEGAE